MSQLLNTKNNTIFASAYGEGSYDTGQYNAILQSETGNDGGLLPNTGYDVWLYVGLGLIIIAVSLFVLMYRRQRKNRSPKA